MTFTAVYYILTAIFALGAFLSFYKPSRTKSLVILIVSTVCLFIVSSLRYGIGFDYASYSEQYVQMSQMSLFEFTSKYRYEFGFCLFMKLCTFISRDPVFFFAAVSLIISALTALFIYTECDFRFWGFAVYFYMTLGYFYGSMNLLRQYLAASVALFSIRFILKRKPIPFFIIVLAASLFHMSALILIPVYFLANIRLNRKILLIYAAVTAAGYIFSEPILKFITSRIYTYYDVDSSIFMQGTGNIYIILPLLIFTSAYFLRDKLPPVFVNYSLFSLIFNILMTKHFILERLSLYFSLPYIVFLPQIALVLYEKSVCLKQSAVSAKQNVKKQRAGKGRQLKEASELSTRYKDAKNIFIAAVIFMAAAAFVYQILAENLNFHGVFPYTMIV